MNKFITVKIIKDKCLRLWEKGNVQKSLLVNQDKFSLYIPFKKPSARELLENFSKLKEQIQQLQKNSKQEKGQGYIVDFAAVNNRNLGTQQIPKKIYFDSSADFIIRSRFF